MTEYVRHPSETYELSGKAVGEITVMYQGEGTVYVQSDHVDFRGGPYRLSFHAVVDTTYANERVELHEMHRTGGVSAVRRGIFDEAPRTYAAQIMSDAKETILANWNEAMNEAGTDADIAQNLNRAERDLAEAHAAYREAAAKVRKLQARVRCTTCGERHRPVDYCQRDGRSHV